MDQNIPVPKNQDDEISVKDLILKLQDWCRYFFKKWVVIVPVGIAGALLGLLYAYNVKVNYVAEITFVLEDNKSNALSSYAGLASQFGIDLGGSSGSGVFSGDNFAEFLRSRLMIEKTLLSPVKVENKEISLAELYIRMNELRDNWSGKPALKNIQFPVNPDRSKFTLQQDSVLNSIYQGIIKSNLLIYKPDKKLSFLAVKCTALNETFSKVFVERVVEEATTFYIDTKTKRSKTNVDKLQLKADSLEYLLDRKTFSLAATQDLNVNPIKRVATVNSQLAARDQAVLQTMYVEVMKNLEISKMAMVQEAPLVQVIDRPIYPLKKEKFGKLKGILMGGILAGVLIIAFLFIRRIYEKIML